MKPSDKSVLSTQYNDADLENILTAVQHVVNAGKHADAVGLAYNVGRLSVFYELLTADDKDILGYGTIE